MRYDEKRFYYQFLTYLRWTTICILCLTVLSCAGKLYIPNQDPEIHNIKESMSIEDAVRALNAGHTFIFLSVDKRVHGSTKEKKNLNFIFTEQGLSYPDFNYFYTTTSQKYTSSLTSKTTTTYTEGHYASCSVSFRFDEIKKIVVKKDMDISLRPLYLILLYSDRWPRYPSSDEYYFCIVASSKHGKTVLAALEKLCPNLEKTPKDNNEIILLLKDYSKRFALKIEPLKGWQKNKINAYRFIYEPKKNAKNIGINILVDLLIEEFGQKVSSVEEYAVIYNKKKAASGFKIDTLKKYDGLKLDETWTAFFMDNRRSSKNIILMRKIEEYLLIFEICFAGDYMKWLDKYKIEIESIVNNSRLEILPKR